MDSVKAKVVGAAIPGVSRLLSAKNAIFKVIWTIVLIIMWSLFLVNFTSIVQRFSLYPVNLSIQYRGVNFQFPDLYVCNPCPVSKSKILYEQESHTTTKINALYEKLNDTMKSISNEMEWNYFYRLTFASIQRDIMKSYMHSKEQTIVKAFISNDLESKEIINGFETFSHDSYHRCFKLKDSSILNIPNKKLTLYLFYDISESAPGALKDEKMIQSWMTATFRGNADADIPSGLILLFSNNNTYPGENAYRMTVGTGMATDIMVSMNSLTLIDAPNKPCVNSKSKVTTFSHWENETTDYIMDSSMCLMYNISMEYHRKCGCVPYNFIVPWEIRTQTRTCYNSSELPTDLIRKDIECVENMERKKSFFTNLAKQCLDLCHQNEYHVQSSYSTWPSPVLTPSVMKKLELDSIEMNSSILEEAPGWAPLVHYGIHNQFSRLHSMMKQSLIKVTFRAATAESVSMEEQRAFPLSSLLSAIGGTFSLYLGLNIMKSAEVIDSLLQIVATMWRKNLKIEITDHADKRDKA